MTNKHWEGLFVAMAGGLVLGTITYLAMGKSIPGLLVAVFTCAIWGLGTRLWYDKRK